MKLVIAATGASGTARALRRTQDSSAENESGA
jgi:hypothetical protein